MLAGGPALYLAGEVLFRIRMIASINLKRVIASGLLCAVGALLAQAPALWLALAVCLILAGLAAWEYDAFGLPPLPRTLPGRGAAVVLSQAPE